MIGRWRHLDSSLGRLRLMRLLEGLGVGITASGLAVVVGLFITSSVGVNWLVHSASWMLQHGLVCTTYKTWGFPLHNMAQQSASKVTTES